MIEYEGDLFTSEQRAIGHGVNTQGVMGAGIAKGFRTFYPVNYGVYKGQCEVGGLRPGGVLIVPEQDVEWNGIDSRVEKRLIVNMASQENPGSNAKYTLVQSSLVKAVAQLQSIGVNSMAVPLIGCGIGGLDWTVVKKGMENLEISTGFEFEVWYYKA